MFRKVAAASFVVLWLVLLGIEFSEDTGFFEYSEPDMDKAVEGTLASLGEAIKVSDDKTVATPRLLPAQPGAIYLSITQSLSFPWVRKETKFIKEDIPIFKFYLVFLL